MDGDLLGRGNAASGCARCRWTARSTSLIEQLIERMEQEDYIRLIEPHDPSRQSSVGGQTGEAQQTKFEITDKSLDFLGFKTLRDLMGSLGKSSFGRHDTRDLATGIEASGASQPYEFGDTLNLDITATLSSAIQREGLKSAARTSSIRTCRCTSASTSPPAPPC